ncbi:MAG: hypothetical protein ACYYK0_03605 [Candidatus Eutrophobiaceae bacterium]
MHGRLGTIPCTEDGDDTLRGGGGQDVLHGGLGDDVYLYEGRGRGRRSSLDYDGEGGG